MRTNIKIDDALMAEALELTGAKTKREVVDTALRELVHWRRRLRAIELGGSVQWEGDLDFMRGRKPYPDDEAA